ncbi:MAG: 50S ribosomal protein L21 [Patescibacteria group bacterium]|nr:50S ribosomal protein L21 [Patescibacteria group bacterium]
MSRIAVIKTGGKQYKVKEGDKFDIEKLIGKEGDKVSFDQILLIADEDGKSVELGKPFLSGKKVEAKIEKQFKDDKVMVIKFKNKTRYRRKKGHRQNKTLITISKIS